MISACVVSRTENRFALEGRSSRTSRSRVVSIVARSIALELVCAAAGLAMRSAAMSSAKKRGRVKRVESILRNAEKFRQTLFRLAHRARQTQLRDVVREHAVDVVELRRGQRLLRLDDLDG